MNKPIGDLELHYPTRFQLLVLPIEGRHYSCDMELTFIWTMAEKLRSIEPNYLIITLSVFCAWMHRRSLRGLAWVWKEMFNFSFEITVVFYTFTVVCWHFFTEDESASGELSGNESKESTESSQVVTINPEDDDKCDPNPCRNGGTCVSNYNYIDGYVCECADDFGGITCGGG